MIEDYYSQYPRLRQFFEERDSDYIEELIGPRSEKVRALHEAAIALVHKNGTGTTTEKEAAMICAAVIIDPPSMYYDMPRLFLEYGEEVEFVIEQVMSVTGDQTMPPVLAEARAASGIAIMEDMARRIENEDALEAKPQEMLDGMRRAFGQEDSAFFEMRSQALLARYKFARQKIFTALEEIAEADRPKPGNDKPRFKPGGNDFNF